MSSSSLQSRPAQPSAVATAGPRLVADRLYKQFPGVRALDDVRLEVWPGEVLAVVGENGAGKSTLMRILAGNQRPDSGTITVDGTQVSFASPADAMRQGVVLIHQELNLADNLTIAENIVLGREPNRYGWMDRRAARETASRWLGKVGLQVDPATSLRSLSVAQKQMVEIAKALSTSANVLIMDEPTSSLSLQESDRLFGLVEELRQGGVSIVYISHRLGEVLRLADRVEVLRDGRNAGSLTGDAIEHDAMVKLMIGRDARPLSKPTSRRCADVRLEVHDLGVQLASDVDMRPPASFVAHGGEIVVLAGLVGAGRSELLETIFGIRPSTSGTIRVDKQGVSRHSIGDSIAAGLALVSEDRKATGLLVESSVRTNTTIAALNRNPRFPFCGRRWESAQTAHQIDALGIKTASQHTTVSTLSGGNQQKIAIAKWLIDPPRVLLLDEPTRGVDIAARQEIYNILLKLAADNVAIVIASSDMEEVIAIADRVLVMHQGRIMGELVGDQISEPNIMQLAVGRELTSAVLASPPN
ncbi:MAG: sugar ABC transporter ATP-binding protein [Planctomycetaceae bacterium]